MDSSQIDRNLTKQHFSTRVYKAYLHYLQTHFPNLDLRALCAECGLPLEYLQNESNWVSVVFDRRFTERVINATGVKNLCFLVGEQQLNEAVVGRPVYFLLKYSVSVGFIFSQISKLTWMFSNVTKIEVIESARGYIHLKLLALSEHLNEDEKKHFGENLPYIFENTIGHYAAVPTCQGLPPAQIEHTQIHAKSGELPCYDIRIHFVDTNPLPQTIGFLIAPILGGVIGAFSIKAFGGAIGFMAMALATLSFWFMIFMSRYAKLKEGSQQTIEAFHRLDQRYSSLLEAQESLAQLSAANARFVPWEFLKLLQKKSIKDVSLGDHVEGEMTILFSDIRGFTSMSEKMSPKETFNFLNSYLSKISPIIRDHNGFIDKYIGDGIMAIFPYSPSDALKAAIAMIRHIDLYNQQRQNSGYEPIRAGIGINSGRLVLGTIGYQQQMQGTVISDCVNTAARLESQSKLFGATIIVSEAIRDQCPEMQSMHHRYLGKIEVPGKKTHVAIYHLFEWADEARRNTLNSTKGNFEKAVDLYTRGKFIESAELFKAVLDEDPDDKGCGVYLQLIQRRILETLDDDSALNSRAA